MQFENFLNATTSADYNQRNNQNKTNSTKINNKTFTIFKSTSNLIFCLYFIILLNFLLIQSTSALRCYEKNEVRQALIRILRI